MITVNYRYVIMMWLCALAVLVSAQLTFSRDWLGGKRSPQLGLNCAQFSKICRHFVRELKQTMTSEISKHHKEEDNQYPYDED